MFARHPRTEEQERGPERGKTKRGEDTRATHYTNRDCNREEQIGQHAAPQLFIVEYRALRVKTTLFFSAASPALTHVHIRHLQVLIQNHGTGQNRRLSEARIGKPEVEKAHFPAFSVGQAV